MEEIRYGPPLKLYDLCINVAVADCISVCKLCKQDFRLLPNTALLDFYERLFQDRRLCILSVEFSHLDVVSRLLYVKGKNTFLLNCHQALLNHGTNLNQILFNTFHDYINEGKGRKSQKELIDIGLQLGSFLNEGGWFDYSIKFLNLTESIIIQGSNFSAHDLLKLLECYRLKLYAEAHYCRFKEGLETCKLTKKVIKKLKKLNAVPHLARIYSNFSLFYFTICSYDEAYIWSVKALELLSNDLTKRVITDVLRQASKSCVVKRKFAQAGFLIRQAMNLGDLLYAKEQHLIFSDILMDYGFYLLNSDSIAESVFAYEKALGIRVNIFEKNSIHIALGQEDLAYALYVSEYSSGNFWRAMDNAEKSIKTMEKILPPDHLLLASVKRVKALILEEIALDERSNETKQKELLSTAENLHISALKLSREFFGHKNVQTAKHFGNLGRLYQSMKQFDEAERMHNKAIAIKEELLGTKDYEVGLSIGHLASLYNYHMKKYKEAEKLYLRSIEINLNLFGPAYSGLEYDYRGLINVYNRIVDPASAVYYHSRYREWKALRENIGPSQTREPLLSPKEIIQIFFDIGKQQKILQTQRAKLAKTLIRSSNVNTDESTNITDDSDKDYDGAGAETDSINKRTGSIDLSDTPSSSEEEIERSQISGNIV